MQIKNADKKKLKKKKSFWWFRAFIGIKITSPLH